MTIIGVCGFNFDPASKTDNPAQLYADWSTMLDRPVDGFAWYSSVPTPGGILRAWANGYLDRYRYAYQMLAPRAAHDLADKIAGTKGQVTIVCHSLGSRVTLRALTMVEPAKVDRILILDGAELQLSAGIAIDEAETRGALPQILNICVRHDRVLRDLGSWASLNLGTCIGYGGFKEPRPKEWRDLFLDDDATRRRAVEAYEWGFDAVDERDPLGHWERDRKSVV